MNTTETRSGQSMENLGELIEAGPNKLGSLEQYNTPHELAKELMVRLPLTRPATILDPQVSGGALVYCTNGWPEKFGIEIDGNKLPGGVNTLHSGSQKVFELVEELMPELRFVCANANPPFGKNWRMANGNLIDSTLSTWRFVTGHALFGFFIANASTIEKLELHQSTAAVKVTYYERRQALRYWPGLRPELEIGVLCWERTDWQTASHTATADITKLWNKIREILHEEKQSRPAFNIYLNQAGFLRTYLSQKQQYKQKLTLEQITRLQRIDNAHPLALVAEKETRDLMRELVECGVYTLQPEALAAISGALAEVNAVACPIMPPNDFAMVAYTEEEEALHCIKTVSNEHIAVTAGKTYPLTTHAYKFTQTYKRNKAHYSEDTQTTYTAEHECELSGTDRYICIEDDHGNEIHFMDRPRSDRELPESSLWDYFAKPAVATVAERCQEACHTNHAVMQALEMAAGYEYYAGQLTYLSRVAARDCALVAATTGAGKSLMAITLMALKSPHRAILIAPQGTMRASKVDEDEEDGEDGEEDTSMSASQWVKELNKFAPYLQVWEIFTYEDYERVLAQNHGQLPAGVFITYFEAFFSNGALENAPKSWDDEKYNTWSTRNGLPELPLDKKFPRLWTDDIGKEKHGIRCILRPCLATQIGHLFDMVLVDEAHKCKGMTATITQMLIRLQAKYRFALTATPIADTVKDLFPLIGWLAVPGWYKGGIRNAAWPFAREEFNRFCDTFLTLERDVTEEKFRRAKDPKWRGKCVKDSPIISSPARLLKLIQPNMAFISKEDCNPAYIKPRLIDVRVPMGKEQAVLYGYYTNRANIPCTNPLVRARKQGAWLRGICTDPAGFTHGGAATPKVYSNMNPKVIATLELCRDILGRGEQVVIINSRIGLSKTIAERLAEAGVAFARIDSTVSAEQHAYQANLFKQRKVMVMVMGLKSAAAYSFDQAENLIIGSLEYSPGYLNQAKGRIDRVTNKLVKNIYVILHRHSIEEVMFDTNAVKDDAANLCLMGKRIPRDFKPVDSSEILADALNQHTLDGTIPESECESKWPALRAAIKFAFDKAQTSLKLKE